MQAAHATSGLATFTIPTLVLTVLTFETYHTLRYLVPQVHLADISRIRVRVRSAPAAQRDDRFGQLRVGLVRFVDVCSRGCRWLRLSLMSLREATCRFLVGA